jgi:hypothetical protein
MQQHLPYAYLRITKGLAHIWPPNGQTTENRAKPSPPSRSPLNLSPDTKFPWPNGFSRRTRLSHEILPSWALGGVHWRALLAFGQYGELGPGFEQLLDRQLAEEGADEAAKRYVIPNRVVAKGVQLRAPAAAAAGGDDSPTGTGR